MWRCFLTIWLVLLCSPALAQSLPQISAPGHINYGEAAQADLLATPPGFAAGRACLLQSSAMPDLEALVGAARASGIELVGLSCFRSVAYQAAVFCRADGCADTAGRARSVAPPGTSEHATGYALDFGVRPQRGCPDLDGCMAGTPGGRWLIANAPRFGFELSFPGGVAQGVTWEPWHWRWVGRSALQPGAIESRILFRTARARFPARPAVRNELIEAPALGITKMGVAARYETLPQRPLRLKKR